MRRILLICLLVGAWSVPLAAQEAKTTSPPRWDARGVGPLPRMGITSLDVSDDGKEIVVGTIAAWGDPNVIVLNDAGKIVRHYQVEQRWIDDVAFLPGSQEVIALCTMPGGKAGDRVEAFRLRDDQVLPEKIKQEGTWFFHHGEHSNHPTMKLARARNVTALLAGNQVVIHRQGKEPAIVRLPIRDPDASVALAVDESGWAVVGTTLRESAVGNNLYLINPEQNRPVWSRAAHQEVDRAPALKKGLYGTPTLPDGTRQELPQRDEKVWAALAVALHSDGAKKRIAVADYQGWQRWVRSSATRMEENQGLRLAPTRPTITIYDEAGKTVQNFAPDQFKAPFWCTMHFAADGQTLAVWTYHWKCRGLAGQPILPANEQAETLYQLPVAGQKLNALTAPAAYVSVASSNRGSRVASLWNGRLRGDWTEELQLGGPALVRFSPSSETFFAARTDGTLFQFTVQGQQLWQTDLNKAVPRQFKPWVTNARATPIVPGVWQIPGGRVESDLGGQRLIKAPDGYILIEGHAGLSFEREWAAMVAVGLDPRKVKYVLATHEHGDHAPGAYLWRVVTGAQFVCSEEMAYTLQHHIPGNTGYGLHPPIPTDIVINKDTELNLAGLKVRALRIPGHTSGSMAWHFEKSGKTLVAFGDLIMPRGVLGYSGSVNFSARDVLSSLKKLRDLNVDYVLPGHGAVEGPANYFHAGIDVGTAVGWGFIKPERPDPRFRLTQPNVLVVGWGQQATSAAFGDLNGDDKPDVVIVSPDGDGAIIRFFLNHAGQFNAQPDHAIQLPTVSQPHKIRVTDGYILVAGKTAALLAPVGPADQGKLPQYQITPFDLGDGNHLRLIRADATPKLTTLVSRRFGGFYALDTTGGKPSQRKWVPEIDGPYCDFRVLGNDLLTAYGQLHRRGLDGKFGVEPILQLPVDRDWNFLAVGDFNGDRQPDVAILSYAKTTARLFYHRGPGDMPYAVKDPPTIALGELLSHASKKQSPPLVRDTPVVADWNGDGIDDLIVAFGQADEVLVLLGGKEGLSKDRVQRTALEYRVHYEHGVYVGDFNGDGQADLAVFGYTNTGVGAGGPPAVYIWLQQAQAQRGP